MMSDMWRPKRPPLLRATLLVCVVSLVMWGGVRWFAGWTPGSVGGLTSGIAAALLMLLAALYSFRRRLMVRPLTTAQDWLQLHVYGSVVAAVFVLIHTGFGLPHGTFGWTLWLLTMWTTLTGICGVFIQKWVPSVLGTQLTVEAIYERIPELVEQLVMQADALVAGAPDVLQRFHATHVRPLLQPAAPSWSYVFDVHAGRERWQAPFRQIEAHVGEPDRGKIADLESIVGEKMQLEAHLTLQRLLRLWPLTHVPAALLLLVAIVLHIAAVWYY